MESVVRRGRIDRNLIDQYLTEILLFILITSKAQSHVYCAVRQIHNRVRYKKKKTKEQQRGTQEEEEEKSNDQEMLSVRI